MGILNIHKAERGARTVIALAGASGSGKTYTALQLAYGMTNFNAEKIGFIDAENKRGSLFSDLLKNEAGEVQSFYIGNLDPPFSPDRYVQAIKEFEAMGVEVLIIDSVTHEWEGTGGCIEIADAHKKPIVGWNKAKTAHKKFMNTLLQCDMHIICCLRAREQMSFQNPDKPISLGVQPIQEKNFMFEMTVSVLMMEEGSKQRTLKCPDALKPFFGRGNDYITSADGLALRNWIDGGKKVDREKERYENRLLMNAEQGLIHIKKCWEQTPKAIQEQLGQEFKNRLYASAESYDSLRYADQQPTENKSFADRFYKNASNPLHSTKEWADWVVLVENFPDETSEIVTANGVPATAEQCLQAKKLVNQLIDSKNAA